MPIRYNKKNNTVTFGDYAKLHFQEGSLLDHKQNGVLDTDVINGLALYLKDMNKEHESLYTQTAIESLHAAFMLLSIRRGVSHAHEKAAKKKGGDK